MKNILQFFYQIVVNDNDIDDEGYFFYNKNYWQIKKYLRNNLEIDKLLVLNNYMFLNNIKINRIVLNIKNEPLSLYENNYYILLKVDYKELEISHFNTFLAPNIKGLNILYRNNWAYLWETKIDYVEYQIKHFIHKYPIIYDTVNYYIGLAENAIMYYKMLDVKNEKLYINHRRVGTEKGFFDPCELVIDYKVRDIAEFIKYNFFVKRSDVSQIINYLSRIKLEYMDYLLLYVRLLFPSYYFDMYDRIINGEMEEKKIMEITKYANEYENLLYNVYLMIRKNINIIEINWLKGHNIVEK